MIYDTHCMNWREIPRAVYIMSNHQHTAVFIIAFLFCIIILPLPVSGNTLTLSITGSPNEWTPKPPNDYVNDTYHLSISSDSSWSITAVDAKEGNKPAGSYGYMANWSSGSLYETTSGLDSRLANRLKVTVGSGTQDTDLSTSSVVLTGSQNLPDQTITFVQPVAFADMRLPTGHSYHMVVTFTGSTTTG
jgi:hypothetical protein